MEQGKTSVRKGSCKTIDSGDKRHTRQGHGHCDGDNISSRTLGIWGLGVAEQLHEDEGYYEGHRHARDNMMDGAGVILVWLMKRGILEGKSPGVERGVNTVLFGSNIHDVARGKKSRRQGEMGTFK